MFFKDPGSITAYTIDWAPWLGTDTISSSTWIVPVGITKTSDANTTTKTTIFLSGGSQTLGTIYEITNQIITVATLKELRTFLIQMAQNKNGNWVIR